MEFDVKNPPRIDLAEIVPLLCAQGDLADPPFEKRPCEEELARLFDSPSYYRALPLHLDLAGSGGSVRLEGKCDGVLVENGTFQVNEAIALRKKTDYCGQVKSCSLLRGKILALALAAAKNLPGLSLRICILAEGEWEFQEEFFTREELSSFLAPFVPRIFALAPLYQKKAPLVAFPYPSLREGQREMIRGCWSAFKSRSSLYACAPTGIGKTLAALFPALKALESGKADQIFYLAPKSTLKKQAAEAVEALQPEKTLRTLVLQAKMQLCPRKLEECAGECEYCSDFYARLPDALAALADKKLIGGAEISAAAKEFALCPFELALSVIPYCDVIIGDYNYIFDPGIALPIRHPENKILLIDEAHNLPARIRENYSESLTPSDLDPFFADPTPLGKRLADSFGALAALFAKNRRLYREEKCYFSFQKPEEILAEAEKILPRLALALSGRLGEPNEVQIKNLKKLFRKIKKFLFLGKQYDGDFATIFDPEGGREINLVIPKNKIEAVKKKWRSALFFSATLLPRDYYFELLGGSDSDDFMELSSPFPPENLFIGVCDVDVSYSQRWAAGEKLCHVIHAAIGAKKGNYMVFLPSFEMLDAVSLTYKKHYCEGQILLQRPGMSYAERRKFLDAFQKDRKETLLAFCVTGGVFSEGIDLAGEALSGEIIIGTGFPPPTARAEAESQLYFDKSMDGKNFAYTLPGFNRVLQAAGRVIRSETDRGFLILCDSRFCSEDFQTLFPRSWTELHRIESAPALKRRLENFWK